MCVLLLTLCWHFLPKQRVRTQHAGRPQTIARESMRCHNRFTRSVWSLLLNMLHAWLHVLHSMLCVPHGAAIRRPIFLGTNSLSALRSCAERRLTETILSNSVLQQGEPSYASSASKRKNVLVWIFLAIILSSQLQFGDPKLWQYLKVLWEKNLSTPPMPTHP